MLLGTALSPCRPSRALETPYSIAGLAADFDADKLRASLSDSDPVTTWADATGGGNDIGNTGANRPTFDAVNPQFNGHASVNFAKASTQYLFGASLPICTALSGSDVPLTVLVVVRRGTKVGTDEEMIWSLGNSASGTQRYLAGSYWDFSNDRQIVRMRIRDDAGSAESVPRENTRDLTDLAPQVLAFSLSGTAAACYVVGSSQNPRYDATVNALEVTADYSGQGAITFDRFALGVFLRSTASLPCDMEVARVLVYTRELSAGERATVSEFLWSRYCQPAAFAPAADLPSELATGLIHHWRLGAGGAGLAGQPQASFNDSIGGKHFTQATEANQPLVIAHNGWGALRFDGVDDVMTAGVAADWTGLHDGSDRSLFVVYRVASTANALVPILDTVDNDTVNNTGIGLYHDAASGAHSLQIKIGATNVTAVVNHDSQDYGSRPDAWHVVELTCEATHPTVEEDYQIWLDNELYAAYDEGVAPSGSASANTLTLGALAGRVTFPAWADGVSIGNRPTSTNWQENSGVARSRLAANGTGDAGHLWHISDSPANRFMAQRISDGAGRGEWTLTGASTSDWEDIASATIGGVDYLYIADIGDNANARSTVTIFRVVEPTITGSDSSTASYEAIACEYPAGDLPSHKDAETIFVDPDSGDVYIVTKRITPAKLYRLAHQASYTGTQTLEFMGDVTTGPFTDDATGPSTGGYYVGGAINDDGTLIVLKNYQDVFVFPRDKATQTITQALQAAGFVVEGYVGGERPSSHPNNEPKGEGICFLANDDLITTSEYNATYGSSASAYPTFRYAKLSQTPTQVSFQDGVDGYAGTSDTYIWSNPANQGDNHGSDTTFVVDYNSGTDERYGLLKFDLSTIPAGATIVGCDLYLNINTEGQFFELYRMFQAWDESSSYTSLGGLPAFDDVDAASVPDARHGNYDTISGTGVIVQVKIPVATIQNWIDGTLANNGWVIYGTTNADGLQFASSENATISDRPRLVVRYTQPATNVLDVGEVLIFDRKLGRPGESQAIGEYLARKWNTSHAALVGGNGFPATLNDAASHRGFPALCQDAAGVWHAIYRRGATHGSSRGVGVQCDSGDGIAWSKERVIYDVDDDDGRDFRGECGFILLRQGAHAGRLLLSTKWSADDSNIQVAGVPSTLLIGTSDDNAGSWTWADPLEGKAILASLDYTASPNGLIELQSGPYAGRVLFTFTTSETGEGTGDQDIRLVYSDDGGATWSDPVVVLHRDSVAWRATEQHIVEFASGKLLMLIRDDTNHDIYSMEATVDDPLSWGSLANRFDGWGRPVCAVDPNDPAGLFVFYRSAASDLASWRYSDDEGATWSAERALSNLHATTGMPFGSYAGMTYAFPAVDSLGNLWLIYGLEDGTADSDVFVRRWADAGA